MPVQQADSLRLVLDRVFASRAYDWAPDADPWAWLRRAWSALVLWLHDLQQASPLAFHLLTYGAIFVLLLIVGHALWVFVRTVRTDSAVPTQVAPLEGGPHDAEWYRQEAARLAAGGEFRAAMAADFQALLLALEARAILNLAPSSTPAEYARQVRLPPAARLDFEQTVRALYGYLFARWPCGPEEYAAWQSAVDPDRYAQPG